MLKQIFENDQIHQRSMGLFFEVTKFHILQAERFEAVCVIQTSLLPFQYLVNSEVNLHMSVR